MLPEITLHSPGHALRAAEVITMAINGGVCTVRDGDLICVWCWEIATTCTLTGGHARCEGEADRAGLLLETLSAPVIGTPFRVGA